MVSMRRICGCVVMAAAVAVVVPATAVADPPKAPTPISEAVATLTNSPDTVSLAAARAVAGIGATDVAGPADFFTAYNTAVQTLQALGIEPFLYPTASPFCSSTSGAPLGLAPAAAGAIPGPWPKLNVLGQDLSAVKPGETMFAFVPYGIAADGADTSGMQVAWFNLSTFKGGFVPMGTVPEVAKKAIPAAVPPELRPFAEGAITNFFASSLPFGGVRAVPVQTGQGTVLAAVFGTVKNGSTSCFFFPTVGVSEVG